MDRLIRVLRYGQPRTRFSDDGIHSYLVHKDVLECGHELTYTGARPERRRCPECGPEPPAPPEQEALF